MKFQITVLVLCAFLSLSFVAVGQNNEASAKEVLEDFFNASGGLDKWNGLNTVEMGGNYVQEDKTRAFYNYYNASSSQLRTQSGQNQGVFSPESFYLKTGKKDCKDGSKLLLITDRSLYANLLNKLRNTNPALYLHRLYTDRPQVLKIAQNPLLDSEDIALVVEEDEAMDQHKKESSYYFLFDANTKLLNKLVQVDRKGEVYRTVDCLDYREVDGFVIAHTQEASLEKDLGSNVGISSLQAGSKTTHIFNVFKFNGEIREALFEVD